MTDHEDRPAPSLIQQRMELERARLASVWTMIGGLFSGIAAVTQLAVSSGSRFVAWYLGVLAVVMIGVGVVNLMCARSRLARFEEQNGVGAGRRDR